MIGIAIFGLDGGPIGDAMNWAYNQRLWWGGPGAAIAGEVGTPLLAMIAGTYVCVIAARAKRIGRGDLVVVSACLLVVSLALASYWIAWRAAEGELPTMMYAGSWFRIENVVGEPELDRSPHMTLHALSRWGATLATPFVLMSLEAQPRLEPKRIELGVN
jgi:hypothetical protein